jgi:hypothetical protein
MKAQGISPIDFCFMAAVAPGIMARDGPDVLALTAYLTGRGVTGEGAIASTLRDYPKLLEYAPAAGGAGGALTKAAGSGGVGGAVAKAAVEVVAGRVCVSFWREGAAFGTAPVSPLKPADG